MKEDQHHHRPDSLRTESKRWVEAANRFGAIIEHDPILPGEYRDSSELNDNPNDIAAGICLNAMNGLPLPIARSLLGMLAQFHEGLGGRAYDRTMAVVKALEDIGDKEDFARMGELPEKDQARLLRPVADAGKKDSSFTDLLEEATKLRVQSFEMLLQHALKARNRRAVRSVHSSGCALSFITLASTSTYLYLRLLLQ